MTRETTWISGIFPVTTGRVCETEDSCYYQVGRNPHFTALLKTTEGNVMSMRPRPVRYFHFLTETVGTNRDGPTQLFLDTVNPKENFWGLSVMDTHRDVLASRKTGVPVMGVTLTSMLQKAVKPGGHVIVKIDIEGAEYLLLEEAIDGRETGCVHPHDDGAARRRCLGQPQTETTLGRSPGTQTHRRLWSQLYSRRRRKLVEEYTMGERNTQPLYIVLSLP